MAKTHQIKNTNNLNVQKKEKINYKKSFKYIWEYLKYYRRQFIFVVFASISISLISSGVLIAQYYFLTFLQDAVGIKNDNNETKTLILYSVFIIFGLICVALLFVFQTFTMTKLAQAIGKSIRKDLYFKILELKLSFFDQNPSGDIMSRLTNDVNNITIALTQNVTQFLVNTVQIFVMIFTLMLFSPILSVVVIVLIPIQLLVVWMIFKKAQPNFSKKQKVLGDINGYVEETISGQKIINSFNKTHQSVEKFKIYNNKIKKIDCSTQIYSSLPNPWNGFMATFMLILMFIFAAILSANGKNFGGIVTTQDSKDPSKTIILIISLSSLIMTLHRNITTPIYQIFQMLYFLQGAIAGIERTFAIKKQENEDLAIETIKIKDIKGHVQFKNLNFSYDDKKLVLKNINLNIKPGQVVGIVGPTGSGKTTIINLLTKFYNVEDKNSDILIDNQSIKTITKESLRNNISIVLQDTYLFNESVYENLRYANPKATNEEIEEAAKMANADHFIRQLKNGYNTILDNNAEELSQGQKQLIALARAFLRKSSILILDEATSSIDTKTEKDIQSAMIRLSKNKTTFMIAHRLSTIKHSDIIIVLKDGEILEQGNHNELLALNGFYAKMYNAKLNTPEDI